MNIFEVASREKFRFQTTVGMLTAEDLWDLPLTSKVKANLDDTAKVINRQLKDKQEGSFVSSNANDIEARNLQVKLDIVKHVIDYKLSLKDKASKDAASKAERQKLLAALEAKETQEFADLSKEQILDKIKSLG